MGNTTNGLPYPENTDPITQGDDAIKALALALDPWARDSGWVNLTLAVGTGTAKYRELGKVVYVVVDVTATTVSGTALALVAGGGLPAAARPTVTARSGGYFAGFPGTVWVGTGGDISALQSSGANRANVSATFSYPKG